MPSGNALSADWVLTSARLNPAEAAPVKSPTKLTVRCKCSRCSVATAWPMTPSKTEITSNPIRPRAPPPTAAAVEASKTLLIVGSRMMLLRQRQAGAFGARTGPRSQTRASRIHRSRPASRRIGLQVQEIFTKVTIPITRMLLRGRLDVITAVTSFRRSCPPVAGHRSSRNAFCTTSRGVLPHLTAKRTLSTIGASSLGSVALSNGRTVDHHAVIAPFQLAQKVWHPFTCKYCGRIHRVA